MAVRHLRVLGYPRPILTLPKTIAYQGAVAGVGTRLRQCGTSGLLMGAIGWSGRPPASQQAKLARGRQSQGARHVTQTQVKSRICSLRSHVRFAWRRRIDDFDKVLQALFISDNERAIEMFDEIRGVIERKHITMEKRIAMIGRILRAGRIHVFGDVAHT